jgi:hypothetical protein
VIVSDGAGGAIIAWGDRRFFAERTHLSVYAQHLNARGRPLWRLGGIPVDTTAWGALLAADGRGGAFFLLYDDREAPFGPTDLYAQHLDARGRELWASQGVPVNDPGDSATYHGYVGFVVDGQGGVIATWEDNRTQTYYNGFYAQRLDSLGTRLWGADGVLYAEHPAGGEPSDLLPDGQGGAFTTWTNVPEPKGPTAQHLSATGSLLWALPGLHLGGGPNCNYPYVTTDMAGGFIATWQDGRGVFYDPYVQRVSATGQVLWNPDGVRLATVNTEFPHIASDGASGAIVVWNDYRSGGFDVYGQRVTPDGSIAPGWPAEGAPISTQARGQFDPEVLAVPGGAIVAWKDDRNTGEGDIYGQRILNDGTLGAPSQAAPPSVDHGVRTPPAPPGSRIAHVSLRAEDRSGAGERNGIRLAPPVPNPARAGVEVPFSLAAARHVEVRVFDADGRLVRRLLTGRLVAGKHRTSWDLRDEAGGRVSSGAYLVAISDGPTCRVFVLHE